MPPAVGKSNKRLLKAGWMSTNGVNGLLPLGPVAKYIKLWEQNPLAEIMKH